MLTSDLEEPVVSETPVSPDLLHPLEILSNFGLEDVGGGVHVITLLVVPLSVEEPLGNRVLFGLLDDLADQLPGLILNLPGPLCNVDLGDLADHMGHSPADSPDGGQGVDDDSLSLNVGVLQSDNVLKVLWVFEDKTLAHLSRFINFNFYLFLLAIASSRSLRHLLWAWRRYSSSVSSSSSCYLD